MRSRLAFALDVLVGVLATLIVVWAFQQASVALAAGVALAAVVALGAYKRWRGE